MGEKQEVRVLGHPDELPPPLSSQTTHGFYALEHVAGVSPWKKVNGGADICVGSPRAEFGIASGKLSIY